MERINQASILSMQQLELRLKHETDRDIRQAKVTREAEDRAAAREERQTKNMMEMLKLMKQ